ncbi:MAG TPA: hypothetical protein VEK33_07160 [Terriglobales bacterium]|nr:hypothetical protein [Terriglobales bacterium]
MIVGITHDSDGRAIQRMSVSTKVAIGLPPNGERNHPTKLDHFVFLKKKKAEEGTEWEPDPELLAHPTSSALRQIRAGIQFLDADLFPYEPPRLHYVF